MLTFSFRLLAYTVCCGTSMMPKGKESHRGGGSRKAEFILVATEKEACRPRNDHAAGQGVCHVACTEVVGPGARAVAAAAGLLRASCLKGGLDPSARGQRGGRVGWGFMFGSGTLQDVGWISFGRSPLPPVFALLVRRHHPHVSVVHIQGLHGARVARRARVFALVKVKLNSPPLLPPAVYRRACPPSSRPLSGAPAPHMHTHVQNRTRPPLARYPGFC